MKGTSIEDVKPQSNPLRRELARGETTEPHPYEDVLAAFAEQTLLERERGKVIKHLSTCKQCREVLGLAAAATPETVIQERLQVLPLRPPLRSWLPWVASAAALAVISSAVLVHERNAQFRERSTNPPAAMAKAGVKSPLEDQPSQAVVSNQGELISQTSIPASQKPTLAAEAASGLDDTYSGAGVRAQWRINGTGQAERSLGSGVWQLVMPDERARIHVIAVFGSDVWLGGESLRLYHSTDDGSTWHPIRLPNKPIGAHAVTHIRFKNEQAGTVDADDGTQWTTIDGGHTWK